jgi:hypothetical protein
LFTNTFWIRADLLFNDCWSREFGDLMAGFNNFSSQDLHQNSKEYSFLKEKNMK